MAASGISKGDKVIIHMNKHSDLWSTWGSGYWIVLYKPFDVGDSWYLKRDTQIIALNSNSADFNGLELVGHTEATDGS